jgi:hypothetical protein
MMALFVTAFAAGPTPAQADDANEILKAMIASMSVSNQAARFFWLPK